MAQRCNLWHFSLALATMLLIGSASFVYVANGMLSDVDSYMRLVRIQEALDHGTWFGDAVSRYDSGRGVIVPWSHVLDGAILLLRMPLQLFLPADQALFWAAAAVGPLSVGLLGMLCAWAAAPLTKGQWLWVAPVLAASMVPIASYGLLGDATHHVLLAVLAVGAWGAGGRAAFGNIRGGVLLGLFSGAGIWLSPEAMPFGMMAFGAVFLSWLGRPAQRVASALGAAGSVLFAVVAFGLLVDPPNAGWDVPEVDRLSVNFLCLALIVFAMSWVPRGLAALHFSTGLRFVTLGILGVAGVVLWLTLFPTYLRGYAALMTPEEVAAFFSDNTELQPIRTPLIFLQNLGPAVLAVAGAFILGLREVRRLPGLLWIYAGTCGVAGIALACVYVRFASYPAVAAAIMLPVLLAYASDPALQRWHTLLRPALLAIFLVIPTFLAFSIAPEVEGAGQSADRKQCRVKDSVPLLAPYPGAVVLANVNEGPELLYRTRIQIVGSIYHEGIAGFMRLRAAWNARDLTTVPPEVRATDARFILICPGAPAGTAIVFGPATTLLDRLNRNDPPPWLHSVAPAQEHGWVLYEIDPVGGTVSIQ